MIFCHLILSSCSGHTFTLTVDATNEEVTYQPLQPHPYLPANSFLADTICFPDHMQTRFLFNLMNATFQEHVERN